MAPEIHWEENWGRGSAYETLIIYLGLPVWEGRFTSDALAGESASVEGINHKRNEQNDYSSGG